MEQNNIGLPEFKIANLFEDIEILKEVQDFVKIIEEKDPTLDIKENELLKKLVNDKFTNRIEM